MKKTFSLLISFLIFFTNSKTQNTLPKVISGNIERIDRFQSKYVTPRNIDVWLPAGYSKSIKYSVLYMHDGQMLYDADQSWNKQAWNVDDIVSEMLAENKVKNFIVVGIWNGGQTRHQDYFPQKPFEELSQPEKDTVVAQLRRSGRATDNFYPRSDNYLKFIIKELKPYIDKKYSVKTNRENTFIAGSSMGGLISMYAICEYPNIFGGAACLSTHWVGTFTLENNPVPDAFLKYLAKKLPHPQKHKIYFDCGDQALDAMYPNIQMKVDDIMKSKGYGNSNWVTKYFPGEDHSEQSWSKRLNVPLNFLLGK